MATIKTFLKGAFVAWLMASLVACQKNETASSTATTEEKPKISATSVENTTTTTPVSQELAAFSFKQTTYDFGTIKQGEKVKYTFEFTNTGKVPLIISDVKPSCGCTTPDWTRSPVPVGGAGKIDVEFDSQGKSGIQVKNVTVYANIAEGSVILQLKGNIEENVSEMEGPLKRK
ncbi:MAG: DUF1573 domain-containing protein [Flammeovirgaceae bacterium]|nr:DUF1573 domain-containing protein [Flammeovirgaceae bacterium]MDW8287487.1 DUF1573 domain-containing protein [Flammeovirgaceae bacterium]